MLLFCRKRLLGTDTTRALSGSEAFDRWEAFLLLLESRSIQIDP